MRKLFLLVLASFLLFYCGPKKDEVERYVEDGVEVIVNRLKPYKAEGESNNLILEEIFTVDTERYEIAQTGLTDIFDFIVDDKGNIYFDNYKNPEHMIDKFDSAGNYSLSFGRKGQGPGELQVLLLIGVTPANEIVVSDSGNKKLVYYDEQGTILKELPFEKTNISFEIPLENGNYVVMYINIDFEAEHPIQRLLSLFNSNLEEIKEFDRYKDKMNPERIKGVATDSIWSISPENIYLGKRDRSYEIFVFDFDGNLLRKIIKEYHPVHIYDEFKTAILQTYKNIEDRKKVYFPKEFPAFQYMFTDDKRRLFVMTYEKGKRPGEYIYDIFNAYGQFIGRTSLINYSRLSERKWYPLPVKAKNNHLYCLREKESSYKELVVYKMRWE